MFTSVAITQFFNKFQEQFSAYNFVGAVYTLEMDFSKLKPLILNTQTQEQRDKAWMGITFKRNTIQPGNTIYRSGKTYEEWTDPETSIVYVYKMAPSSCEVNFDIISNEPLHLEALENELRYYYNGRYEYDIDLNKLPHFKLDVNSITYGELTKYNSKEYGQLCSLGMGVVLNFPILLKNNNIGLIRRINYYLAKEMPDNVFYTSTLVAED